MAPNSSGVVEERGRCIGEGQKAAETVKQAALKRKSPI